MARRTAKKQLVWIDKTTTLRVHHTFLYIFFPSLHGCDVKLPVFTFYVERELKTMILIFFFKLRIRPLKINSRKIRQHLTNWTRWNNGTEVWNKANTLFWWRFVYHMLLVLVKMCECGNKLSNVRSCILSSGKGLTSLNNNNRVTSRLNFLVKKKKCKNETFWRGFFRKREKTLN